MFKNKAQEGIDLLLGLRVKCCVQRMKFNPQKKFKTVEGLRNNTRWKYIFHNQPEDGKYIPGLCMSSKREPNKLDQEIEACVNNFGV